MINPEYLCLIQFTTFMILGTCICHKMGNALTDITIIKGKIDLLEMKLNLENIHQQSKELIKELENIDRKKNK